MIQDLPAGWNTTTLGEVCDKPEYGWTTKAVLRASGLRLLRTTDISKGIIDWSSVPFCEQEPSSPEKFLLSDGDIVISRAGSVGVSALIHDCPEAVFASYLIRFRANSELEKKYLHYYLSSPSYWEQISQESAGIALQNVNAKKLAGLTVPLPPLAEQRRIVAEIETQFTRLDVSVAALRRAQANLKRYRASVLKDACEGRLVTTEAELARSEGREYEPAAVLLERILAERRARWESQEKRRGKYREPSAPDISALPELPEGWVWATVEELGALGAQPVLTGPFGTTLKSSDFTSDGTPVLTIGCLTVNGINLEKAVFVTGEKASELSRYTLKEGDVLFSRMATVGRAGMIGAEHSGALFNYHIMRLRLNGLAVVAQYYMAYVRGSSEVERYLTEINHGATRDGINTSQLLTMPFALPPLAEQRRIVAEVERRLSVVQQAEATVAASLARAERLRQSILKQAFSGRLVPQDPDDEPASALLERIRAEREAEAQTFAEGKGKSRRRGKEKATA